METSSLSEGRKVIAHYCASMSGTPGVYRMIDSTGTILYVGKARHLKNRVSNYLNVGALNTRLQNMISQTASMEIVTTRSEAEALLLESNLIKKFSPRYNILLKDDKTFPYIFFSGDHASPRISKHRGAKVAKGKYFGPFVSSGAVDETITLLQKAFRLRTCTDSVFSSRTRPCMLYQIKRCAGPCVGKIDEDSYRELSTQAQAFLSGKSREIQEGLLKEMEQASGEMDYERAAILRDRARALTQVQQQSSMDSAVGDADVIALAREGKDACIQLFSFRGGRNYGNRVWFPAHIDGHEDEEIISNFIGHYYQTQPPPKYILTSLPLAEAELLEEGLKLQYDVSVHIEHPQRGDKRTLMDQVVRNAKEALLRHQNEHVQAQALLEDVGRLFGLEETPSRIEVVDNSHISGTHALGAMIVSGPEGFIKKEYRIFNIKNEALTPGDDYGMLREMLTRRFKKLEDEVDAKRPDLLLIDGGQGQLSVATQVFEELGISDIPYVAIAKGPDRNAGREWFHMPGREPFQLPPGDRVLHFLQRLRDEAHRFAIGSHRNKRSSAIPKSELDSIAGIGPARKKALLHHFGSARGVGNASIEEILQVSGINKHMAEIIYGHFHG